MEVQDEITELKFESTGNVIRISSKEKQELLRYYKDEQLRSYNDLINKMDVEVERLSCRNNTMQLSYDNKLLDFINFYLDLKKDIVE